MIRKPAIWKRIGLSEAGNIILASEYENGDALSLHDLNHNIFRLDNDGNIVWQVRRFECGRSNWRKMFRRLKQEGGTAAESAVRQPFMSLRTTFVRRGRFHPLHTEYIASEDLSQIPQPDFVLIASTGNEWYEVDIDTGVATNVTPRPWAAHW